MLLESLNQGLKELKLEVPEGAESKYIAYVELLAKWNRAYNLTSVREPLKMITRHLLDSLSIAPFIQGKRILDVGTGAGLPGIPLAILYPDRHVVLLDSNGKKTRFLTHTVNTLSLPNVTVTNVRVENYYTDHRFDSVISRAFASIKEMLSASSHLGAPQSHFLAMKGAYPTAELNEIPNEFKVSAIHQLTVPGLDAERHLVCLSRSFANTTQSA